LKIGHQWQKYSGTFLPGHGVELEPPSCEQCWYSICRLKTHTK